MKPSVYVMRFLKHLGSGSPTVWLQPQKKGLLGGCYCEKSEPAQVPPYFLAMLSMQEPKVWRFQGYLPWIAYVLLQGFSGY